MRRSLLVLRRTLSHRDLTDLYCAHKVKKKQFIFNGFTFDVLALLTQTNQTSIHYRLCQVLDSVQFHAISF